MPDPMALLRLLGGLSLSPGDGAEITSVTAQPKRIALLARVVLAGRAGVRRDTILGLLWPELDAARARHALRQSLYALRRELPGALLANGDEAIRCDPAALQCDVVDFEAALHAGDPARALELYRGDLLPGFYLSGCVEFEQWLESARHRLRLRAIDAAGTLAGAASAAGDRARAVRWSRRACELAPFDEPLLRAHMEALEAAGDGAGALLAYEAFAARSRRELGLDPGAETESIVARIRARGAPRRRRRRSLGSAPDSTLPGTAQTIPQRRFRFAYGVLLLTVLLGSAMYARAAWRNVTGRLDPSLIAIPPFRVLTPDADSLVHAEGIPELLEVALQGEYEPDVISARVAAHRWHAAVRKGAAAEPDLAMQVASSLGAALVVYGSVFVRGERLVIVASLAHVTESRPRVSHTVEGNPDELVSLVDQLATKVLGALSREDPLHLPRLVSTSYPAVQAYLTGRIAARRGRYDEAYQLLARALEIDSTFALAALALVDVSGWAVRGDGMLGHYERHAFRHRDRLGPADTAHLRAWIGTLAYTGRGTSSDLMLATERAAAALPHRPEVLYLLGDRFYHNGAYLARPEPLPRARELFERAFALDSGYAPAREHLLEIAVIARDTREAKRQLRLLLEHEPDGIRTPYLRWLAAQFIGDDAARRELRAALDTMNLPALVNIVRGAVEIGTGLDDAEIAARGLLARASTPAEREMALVNVEILYHNRGLLAAAARIRPWPAPVPETGIDALQRALQLAMFADAPPLDTARVRAELERRVRLPATTDSARRAHATALHALYAWKLWHGDTAGIAAELPRLRAQPPLPANIASSTPITAHVMRAAVIDALLEHATRAHRDPRPRPARARLDSLARTGAGYVGNLVLIRLYAETGEPQRALAAARRRLRATGPSISYLAPTLRAEARLAAATGDRAGARRAYAHYLALRARPDARLRPEADSMRAEYRRLH